MWPKFIGLCLALAFICGNGKAQELNRLTADHLFIQGIAQYERGHYKEAYLLLSAAEKDISDVFRSFYILLLRETNLRLGEQFANSAKKNMEEGDLQKACLEWCHADYFLGGNEGTREQLKKTLFLYNEEKERKRVLEIKKQKDAEIMEKEQKKAYQMFLQARDAFLRYDFQKALLIFEKMKKNYPLFMNIDMYLRHCRQAIDIIAQENYIQAQAGEEILETLKQYQKDVQSVEEEFQEERQKEQVNALRYFKRAKEFAKEKDFFQALENMEQALLLVPDQALYLYYRDFYAQAVESQVQMLEVARSINELSQTVTLAKKKRKVYYQGVVAFLDQSYKEAFDIFSGLVDQFPEEEIFVTYRDIAQEFLIKRDQMDEMAISQVDKAFQEKNMKMELWKRTQNSIVEAYEGKNYDGMLVAYNETMALLDPGSLLSFEVLDHCFALVQDFVLKKMFQEALPFCQFLLKFAPEETLFLRYEKLCQEGLEYEKKQLESASFLLSVQQYQDNINGLFSQAKDLQKEGEYALSNKILSDVLELDPYNIEAKNYKELNDDALRKQQKGRLDRLKKEREYLEYLDKNEKISENYQRKEELKKNVTGYIERKEYPMALRTLEWMIDNGYDSKEIIEQHTVVTSFMEVLHAKENRKIQQSKENLKKKAYEVLAWGKELYEQNRFYEAVEMFKSSWEIYPEDEELLRQAKMYVEKCSSHLEDV